MRWLAPLILIVLTAAARAETGTDRVQFSITAPWVAAGQPFDVRVRFRIDPGWHIYWTNPGDSGLATAVKLHLPPGFTAGPVLYPVPQVLPQPGGLVNYGYENDATLVILVTPPAALPAGQKIDLTVTADWLVCRERCLVGHSTQSLSLPVNSEPVPNAPPFPEEVANRARLIRPSDPQHVRGSHTTVNGTRWTVAVDWSDRPTDVAWVPAVVPGAEVTDVTTTPTGFAFTVTPLTPGKQPPVVDGVLTYAAGGQRIGVATVLKADPSPSAAK